MVFLCISHVYRRSFSSVVSVLLPGPRLVSNGAPEERDEAAEHASDQADQAYSVLPRCFMTGPTGQYCTILYNTVQCVYCIHGVASLTRAKGLCSLFIKCPVFTVMAV